MWARHATDTGAHGLLSLPPMKVWASVGAILLWTWSAAEASTRPALDYWVAPTTELIQSGTLSWGAGRSASLTAARGEREAFFVMLPGSDPGRATVEVKASVFVDEQGVIAPTQVRAWRAAWVRAEGKRFPDALLPLTGPLLEVEGISPVKRGDDLVLYVELSVPRDAVPGPYTGSVRVMVAGGEATIPVALEVMSATLPERASLVAGQVDHGGDVRVGMPGYSIRSLGWTAWSRHAGSFPNVRGLDPCLFYASRSRESEASRQVESVRLKLLEEGLEDYELLRAADQAGKGVLARVMAMRMTRHPEVIDFDAVRAELFRALAE